MTRIICLTTSYPLFETDISGHFVRRLNQIYQYAGYQVTVICFARDSIDHVNLLSQPAVQQFQLRPIVGQQ